jgi:hypothetical protein
MFSDNNLSSTILPNSSVSTTEQNASFNFLTSGSSFTPKQGQLIKIVRGIWYQGSPSEATNTEYYTYPFTPNLSTSVTHYSSCASPNGSISLTDVSGNYDGMPRTFELIRNGTVISTVNKNATNHTFSNLSPGDYEVQIRIKGKLRSYANPNCGNDEVATQAVTINNNTGFFPDFSASKTAICINEGTRLTASGGNAYYWPHNQGTGSSFIVSPTQNTTYSVTITGPNGCSAVKTITILVSPLPTKPNISYSGSNTCEGIGKDFNVSNAIASNTYSWGNGVTALTTNIVPPLGATSLSVNVTATSNDAFRCTNSTEIIVPVVSRPSISGNTNICQGASTTLSVNRSGATFNWGTNATTSSITVSPTNNTTYTVNVTTSGCVFNLATIVNVNAKPTVSLGSAKSYCAGGNITLNPSITGAGPYLYQWSTSENTSTITVNPASTTTYSLTVTDANLCTGTSSVSVSRNPLPIVNAGANQTINFGASATLTASASGATSPYTFLWSENSTSSNITVSPNATITYSVTATDAKGCKGSNQVMVTVLQNPVANVGAGQTICQGTSATLTATAAGGLTPYTFSWSNGVNLPSITVSPNATTTYTVTVTDSSIPAKTHTAQVTVTVNPKPIADSPADAAICWGDSMNLAVSVTAGTSPYTYFWSTNTTTTSIKAKPTLSTKYKVSVTDSKGCVGVDSTFITINAKPSVDAGLDQEVCSGFSRTFSASASDGTMPYSYAWSNSATNSSITVSSAGSYAITVTDSKGCKASDQAVLAVNALPIANAGAGQSICFGASATLSGSANGGLGPYIYTWTQGASTIAMTPNKTVSPTSNTTYSLSVKDSKNCTNTSSTSITVKALPQPELGPNKSICKNSSTTLSVSIPLGTYAYSWSTGATSSSISVSPLRDSIFMVTVTGNGCQNTDQLTVSVNPIPTSNISSNQIICSGDSLNIGVNPQGGSAPYVYYWTTGVTTASLGAVKPTASTKYKVTITDNNACVKQDSVSIVVNALPTVDAGATKEICAGTTANLMAIAGGNGPFLYNWSDGKTLATISVSPTQNTTFTVSITDSKGCKAQSQVLVKVNSLPVVNAGPDQTICKGGIAVLNAAVNGGTSPFTYNWGLAGNASNISVSPANDFVYTLSVIDSKACTGTDQVQVKVNGASLSISGNLTVCHGDSTILTAIADNGTFQWSNGSNNNSIKVAPTLNTRYLLTLSYAGNCVVKDSALVQVNQPPSFDLPATYSTCEGVPIQIAPQNLSGAASYLFSWIVPESSANPGNVQQINAALPGKYELRVSNNATTCAKSKFTVLQAVPKPNILPPSLVFTCSGGNQTAELLINAGVGVANNTGSQVSPLNYLYRLKGFSSWSTSSAPKVSVPAGTSREYEVSVQYQNGLCANNPPIASVKVPAIPMLLPVPTFTALNASDCFQANGSISIQTGNSEQAAFLEFSLIDADNGRIRNWQEGTNFFGLSSGNYRVELRFSPKKLSMSGCSSSLAKIESYPVGVGSNTSPEIQSIIKRDLTSCSNPNGAAEIKATYLGLQLLYSMDGGNWQTSAKFTDLAAGSHTARVRPAYGCTNLVVSQNFDLAAAPVPSPITVTSQAPISCINSNGTITVNIPEHLKTNAWQVSINGGASFIQNQWNWSGLGEGNYQIVVTAQDGSCKQNYASPIIFTPACVEICDDGIDNDRDGKTDCEDDDCQPKYQVNTNLVASCRNDGQVTFQKLNNAHQFRLLGQAWGDQTVFSNLVAGPVTFEVRSDKNCISKINLVLYKAPPLVFPSTLVQVKCLPVGTPGAIIVSRSSSVHEIGYKPLAGNWTWLKKDTISNLSPGPYLLSIREGTEGSCALNFTDTIHIFAPGAPTLNTVSTVLPSTCASTDGKITINAKGYKLEYAIKILGSSDTLRWGKSNQFSGLSNGTYELYVRHGKLDANYCSSFNSSVLNVTQALIRTAPSISSVNVQGPTNACINLPTYNGSININASAVAGAGPLVYSIDGGITYRSSPLFTALGPGNYTPTIAYNDRSCKVTGNVSTMNAQQPPAISSVTTTAPMACAQLGGKISINASVAGSWQYSIDSGRTFQTSKDFLNLKTQTSYQVVMATADKNCKTYYGSVSIPKKADCVELCADGIDNDGNGLTDCDDPACGADAACPAGADRVVCAGVNLTLGQTGTSNPSYCYTWVPETGLATPKQPTTTLIPTQSGEFELVITDAQGQIIKRDKVKISVLPAAPLSLTSAKNVYCGTPIALQASAGFTQYAWKDSLGTILSTGASAAYSASKAGLFKVSASKSGWCDAEASISIPELKLGINPGNTISVCPDNQTGLNAVVSPSSGLSLAYRWSTGASTSNINVGAGLYQLTLTESVSGCQISTSKEVKKAHLPSLTASPAKSIVCLGQTTQLQALVSNPALVQSYHWTGPNGFSSNLPNPQTPPLSASTAGDYLLSITLHSGCTLSASTSVGFVSTPTLLVCSSGPICPGTELKLSATYGFSYQWSGPGGFSSTAQNPVLSNAQPGTYTAVLTDANGCTYTLSTDVIAQGGTQNGNN